MEIDRYTRYCIKHLKLIKKAIFGTDKRNISDYLNKSKIKKLQIGSGNNILEGWLNTDFTPPLDNAIHLDATKKFPFKDATFHYVFSEHMIEHISYPEGMNMLSECYRILKSGGKIRIATPNLAFLFELYKSSKSAVQNKYVQWSFDAYDIPCANNFEDTFIINNFMRDWGHTFIYDEKVLHASLDKVGFTDIQQYNLTESDESELKDLENIDRMPHDFLRLETMVFECTKPAE